MNHIGLRIILRRLRVLPFFMKDKTVPLRKKLLVVLGILYLCLPTDILPFFPLDDFFVWVFIIWHLKDELDRYWTGDKSNDLSRKFRGSDIIDGVDFTVYEGGKDENGNEEND